VSYPVEEIPDQRLAATAAHSSQGLSSAEDEAFAMFPDTAIDAAIEDLPEPFRMVGYYAAMEDLKDKETPEIIGTPHGTVTSRLPRARGPRRYDG
jgi:RNA polymerase sigma-70 factor (ECF subfamily)